MNNSVNFHGTLPVYFIQITTMKTTSHKLPIVSSLGYEEEIILVPLPESVGSPPSFLPSSFLTSVVFMTTWFTTMKTGNGNFIQRSF